MDSASLNARYDNNSHRHPLVIVSQRFEPRHQPLVIQDKTAYKIRNESDPFLDPVWQVLCTTRLPCLQGIHHSAMSYYITQAIQHVDVSQ